MTKHSRPIVQCKNCGATFAAPLPSMIYCTKRCKEEDALIEVIRRRAMLRVQFEKDLSNGTNTQAP